MKQTLGFCCRESYETNEIEGEGEAMKQVKLGHKKPNVAVL